MHPDKYCEQDHITHKSCLEKGATTDVTETDGIAPSDAFLKDVEDASTEKDAFTLPDSKVPDSLVASDVPPILEPDTELADELSPDVRQMMWKRTL